MLLRFSNFLQQLQQSLLSLLRIVMNAKLFATPFPKTTDEELYILGNGPSLAQVLADEELRAFLEKKTTMGVNQFASTPTYAQIKPKYYIMADSLFWQYEEEAYRNPDQHGIFLPNEEVKTAFRRIADTFKGLREQTTWPITIFLPHQAKTSPVFTRMSEQNPNIQFHYFNSIRVTGFTSFSHWLYQRNLGLPGMYNILAVGIYVGINMGFRNVYTLGADHNWLQNLYVDNTNQLVIRDLHFYRNASEAQLRPILVYEGTKAIKTNIAHQLIAQYRAFSTYYLLEAYAQQQGCEVYNLSDPSFIDAFKREDIRKLAAQAH